ncbi:MAG: HEAT repeat domain-containing protein, partial [Planctomycetota bacterium]
MRASVTRRLACRAAAVLLLIAPASRGADLAALVERIPNRDRDGKHTGPAPEQAMEIYRELLKGGARSTAANVRALVGMLVEPGKGEDYKARYVLHGLVTHVTRPGTEDARRAVGAALISSLESARSPNVKAYVVGELQFLADRRAVRSLGKLLTDDALSDSAARALVSIGPEAAPELARAVRAARGRNRLSVVLALGEVGDSKSVDALVPLLRDPDDATRLAAAAALGKIADVRAVEPLMRALDSTKGQETIGIAEACFVLAGNLIKARKGDEALTIFRHMWKSLADRDEPQIKHAVVEGLAAGLSSLPTDNLVRRLRSGDPATRAAIL